MLNQILLNLVSNAIKFTEPGGRIEIGCEEVDSGCLRVSVADTGIGMSESDIPKAMSRFGQVDSNWDKRYNGTGLGLSLVQSFIELHDGRFEIESEIGVGTRAMFTFPRERVVAWASQAQ